MDIIKMHGLGNDFIMLMEDDVKNTDVFCLAKRLCERRLSVGADGLIIACASDIADIKMRIVNADGSEAEMCGNGLRCFAKLVYEKGLVKKTEMEIETLSGIIRPSLTVKNGEVSLVRVDMGKPLFKAEEIPALCEEPMNITLNAAGEDISVSALCVGVPHAIVFVRRVSDVEIEKYGPAIERSELFPRGINVDFVEVKNSALLKIRTWERGAGATLACGTGACSAGVAAFLKGKIGEAAEVVSTAGTLKIEYSGENVFMTGPAQYVFEGKLL